jgi:predicted phosphodiesterase
LHQLSQFAILFFKKPKYNAVGDIHGRPFWKRRMNESFDEFFILGDYFDSYRMGAWEDERENYCEIVAAARADSRIKLCLGNHDFHYLSDDEYERYSRYDEWHAAEIRELLLDASDLMKIVYVRGDVIISHAGLSNSFMAEYQLSQPEEVNAAYANDKNIAAFNGVDPYGDDPQQGPLWIRPDALLGDALDGYSQVVGHTVFPAVQTIRVTDDDPEQGPLWIRPDALLGDALEGYSQVVGHTVFPAVQTMRVNEDDPRDLRTVTFIDTGERRSVYRW